MSDDAASRVPAAAADPRFNNLFRSFTDLRQAVDADPPAATATVAAAPPPTPAAPPGVGGHDAHDRRRQERREIQVRHAAMLDGLIRSLDIVAYAQISILYYMDNSLARLLLRLVPHWLFFTPKPAAFPPPPRRRPYVMHVVLANLTCALLHILLAAPAGSEATREYLHGGFLIDFVGELGPMSKVRLLAADMAVLIMQVVLLAAVRERERLRDLMGSAATSGANAGGADASSTVEVSASTLDGSNEQDHDAEEQGIRRDLLDTDPLLEDEDDDAANLAVGTAAGPDREQHPLDRFYTGQFVVADLFLWDALRMAWKETSA